jgi:hypothetical protein
MKIEEYLRELKDKSKHLFDKDCPFPKESKDIMENLQDCQIIKQTSKRDYELLIKFDGKFYDVEYKAGKFVGYTEKKNIVEKEKPKKKGKKK